ncbi:MULTISPECIES: hypothetical protein [Stenotrophomonas]|jgi:hypothetical protein|uniref:hypothetical protein n=1 Tax=Stenotrophomonas TaxID=40323 RepID=UPI000FF9B064|nr:MULTISPECIES: hypothetical protein [Stenotrophomonas]
MAEDQGGEEVIREIGKALALASELDPQIVRSLRSAIVQAMSDYEDDTNAQAAAALAAVLDFRPVTTQDALSQTLGEIGKLVQGLTGLEDVHYTVETPEGRRVRSIRSHLPTVSPQRLTDHEQADLEAYIARYLPPDDPREEHAPRGPRL